MATYKKREMNRREYLVQMGAVFLKSLRELSKRGINNLRTRLLFVGRPSFCTLICSSLGGLSPLASEQDSDLDQFDPFPVHVRDLQRAIRTIVEVEVIFQNYFFWGSGSFVGVFRLKDFKDFISILTNM